MRAKLNRYAIVTIRPLNPQTPDVFGDAPVVMPDNRLGAFQMKAQITHMSGMRLSLIHI